MDRFTKVYSIILATVAVFVLFQVFYESPAVSRLNSQLAGNGDVAAYPYPFRVLSLDDGVATMGTPRTAGFAAHRALALMYPHLEGQQPDSPAMLEAQQELARVQGIARGIVESSDEVRRVTWELDERWLRGQGVDPDRF